MFPDAAVTYLFPDLLILKKKKIKLGLLWWSSG